MHLSLALSLAGIALGAGALAAAVPPQLVLAGAAADPTRVPAPAKFPRPLVIWHGLGDTAHSEGIDGFIDYVRELYPGIFVYSVEIPEGGSANEQSRAGWGQDGCDQLSALPELADGFDAIGFSQGGLYLRWYAQFCEDGPRVRNLLTFGSPHNGIAALIPCPEPPTLACTLAARAARAGIYTAWAQRNLVQAQYFRDPARLDEFLFANSFLRDLNGEALPDVGEPTGREDGGMGLGALQNVVAVAFDDDKTVFPALSSHWAVEDPANTTAVIPLRKQQLYKDDWIGLRKLDKAGKLHLVGCPGGHMELGGEGGCADQLVRKWIGWEE